MLSPNPTIMGILNLTPDSFSDGNKYSDPKIAIKRIEAMISEGAGIIDIGGESTRPGADPIDIDTEWERVHDILKAATKYDILLSIDTYKPEIAERALQNGAKIINDIATFEHLEEMVILAKKYSSDLVVTHNSRQQPFDKFNDLLSDIENKFESAIVTARELGLDPQRLIFDIGLGFGKTNEQDIELLKNFLNIRTKFSQRFMIGASRKSFMRLFNEQNTNDRLPCTLAVTLSTYLNGCDIFRVHDVHENYEVLKFAQTIYEK